MKELVKKRPLIWFYVLAYLFSWIVWIPLIFADSMDPELRQLIMLIGVLGPFAAALTVSRILGSTRTFLAAAFKWKVPLRWYFAACFLPLFMLTAILLMKNLFGSAVSGGPAIETLEGGPWYIYPLVLLFMIFLGGGMEEPGWRGFAQKRMLCKFTPFTASVILGIIWTYWHLPLFLIPGSSQQGMESQIIWYTFSVIGLSITMTWLFIQSKGSGLLAILFHGGVNAINSWIPEFHITIFSIELNTFAVVSSAFAFLGAFMLLVRRDIFFRKLSSNEFTDLETAL